MKLSIIIPCFNAAKTLGYQLEALSNQQWQEPWEVIVVDNCSTDCTLQVVSAYMDKLLHLRVVKAFERQGVAYARNYGATVARAQNLAFCDADDEVASGWVAAMGTALEQFDLVGGCCELKKMNPAWAIKSRCGGVERDTLADGLLQSRSMPDFSFAAACNLGVKRSVHKMIGGFDESLIACEDTEYCRQAHLQGISIQYVPEAVVHYRLRHSLAGLYKQAYVYAQNQVLIYEKHCSIPNVSTRPLAESIMSWRFLAKGVLKIRNKGDLAQWVFSLGWRLGHEAGKKQYLD